MMMIIAAAQAMSEGSQVKLLGSILIGLGVLASVSLIVWGERRKRGDTYSRKTTLISIGEKRSDDYVPISYRDMGGNEAHCIVPAETLSISAADLGSEVLIVLTSSKVYDTPIAASAHPA